MKTKNKPAPSALDYEYSDSLIIPADYGLGYKWIGDNGEKWSLQLSRYDFVRGKRIARLILSSCIGSIGGMHYYGRITVSKPGGIIDGEPGSHGGYMGEKAPFVGSLSLNVTRRLSKVEKDMEGEPIGKIGDRTYRFNLEKDVLPEAIKLFKRKFGPGWVLVNDYEHEKILCET